MSNAIYINVYKYEGFCNCKADKSLTSSNLKLIVCSKTYVCYLMKPASPSTPGYVVVEERKDAFPHPSPTGQEERELKACAGTIQRRGLVLPSAAAYSECYEGRMVEEYKPSQNTQRKGQEWGRSTILQIYSCYQFPKLFLESSGLGVV